MDKSSPAGVNRRFTEPSSTGTPFTCWVKRTVYLSVELTCPSGRNMTLSSTSVPGAARCIPAVSAMKWRATANHSASSRGSSGPAALPPCSISSVMASSSTIRRQDSPCASRQSESSSRKAGRTSLPSKSGARSWAEAGAVAAAMARAVSRAYLMGMSVRGGGGTGGSLSTGVDLRGGQPSSSRVRCGAMGATGSAAAPLRSVSDRPVRPWRSGQPGAPGRGRGGAGAGARGSKRGRDSLVDGSVPATDPGQLSSDSLR